MITEGTRVKVLLRNNTIVDGIVQEWGETIKLQSLNDQSYMIILHPKEDIILIKVFPENSSEEIVTVSEEVQTELEQQFQQVLEQPSEDSSRLKSLAELRELLVSQERQIIANKLKQHHIGQPRKVEYGSPRFFTKSVSK